MNAIVNFEILRNPANWVIIFLVLYFVALAAKLVQSAAAGAPIQLPTGLI